MTPPTGPNRRDRATPWGVLCAVALALTACAADDDVDAGDVVVASAGVVDAGGGDDAGAPSDAGADTHDTSAAGDVQAGAGGRAGDDTGPVGPAVSTAAAPSLLVFSAPQPWSTPIADHLAAAGGASDAAIHSIAAMTDGAWVLGYGASAGAGSSVAVAFRGVAADGGGVVGTLSHDSALRRFQRVGDTIWAPGGHPVDSNKGNLYRYPPGGPWQRYESVPLAEAIDDVWVAGQTIWLAGVARAAAEQPQDYRYATLWRSDDGGSFFEIVWQSPNAEGGVARLGHLYPVGGQIVALGEKIDAQGKVVELPHVTFDGTNAVPLAPSHALKSLHPRASGLTPGGDWLLGADDVLAPGDPVLLRCDDKGVVALDPAGHRLVATYADAASGETLLLEESVAGAFRVRALRKDGELVDVLLSTKLSGGTRASAVAYRQGVLVLGTEDGALWKLEAAWRDPP